MFRSELTGAGVGAAADLETEKKSAGQIGFRGGVIFEPIGQDQPQGRVGGLPLDVSEEP
jgi:hypothetical protein